MEHEIHRLAVTMAFQGAEETVYPTVLRDGERAVLVDCGWIGALPVVERELKNIGLSVRDLTGLVLTHHDHDHMGAAAALRRANPDIKVYASPPEEPFISGREKPLRLQQAEEMQETLPPEMQEFGRAFCELLRRVEPVETDGLLQGGEWLDWCGGCRVIATPGHTPGHISLLLEDESIVITGDAMALENGLPVTANPQFALDREEAEASLEKLLALKARAYYCYHGGVYLPN
ncbi:MAG: MBL fold metallo-hydrolase [Oscillibacter ruminantium]|uniref:MBL fold metallo-hydrolase n=1 Tax=Oscillibacter ruminantium TaxID=1263547 RepID=UPI002B1E96D4|nr:MBL fold metallo-hydrolase [Oscillibacter ruminantium]MEA5042502.1 MBL fold metallo-hydrolase [Oscillibacter ruminantium]